MSSDPSKDFAIRVRGVAKHYVMFERPEDRFKQMVVPRLQRLVGIKPKRYFRDFAALNGVSLEVGRGETVGIIGRNGSGKSTLLQIICGTLQPTSGAVEVNGRIAALLELGAGFNPEFTGRENVFLNAQILGVPRQEMEWRFDDIARFADIGAFIEQPVKTYSSGMYVRLAFAVAINVDPDILVVDEALSVGDEAFQRKCFARIEDIKDRGGTILFVSHGAQTIVQLCDRAVLIDCGEKLLEGHPKSVANKYSRLVSLDPAGAAEFSKELRNTGSVASDPMSTSEETSAGNDPMETVAVNALEEIDFYAPDMPCPTEIRYHNLVATIRAIRIEAPLRKRVNMISMGHRYKIAYSADFERGAKEVAFGFTISTPTGFVLVGVGTSKTKHYRVKSVAEGQTVNVEFEFDCLLTPGTYFLTAGVSAELENGREYFDRVLDGAMFKVNAEPESFLTGYVDLNILPSFEVVETVR